MRDSTASPSVMIISDDTDLVAALVRNNKTDQDFICHPSINFVLDDPSLLENNSIVIFDIASNGNSIESTTDQVLRLKQLAPTQILILTGLAEPLGNVLKTKIQPLIFRAFTKPVSANQVLLAFKSGNKLHSDLVAKQAAGFDITAVGPVENRTNVDSLMGERKKGSTLLAGVSLLLIAGAIWYLFEQRSDQVADVVRPEPAPIQPAVSKLTPKLIVAVPSTTQKINQLNQFAAAALLEGRITEPRGGSALDYYNQVLALDPYDSTAYQGKKSIAVRLRNSYQQFVAAAEFDQAVSVIVALEQLEPLNLDNDRLRADLGLAIDSHVKQIQKDGSSKQIAATTAVLEKIETEFSGSISATKALQAEKAMISKIDTALKQDLLTPPQSGNAYSLVLASLKANTISHANITPRVKGLSAKLLRKATASTNQDRLEEARQFATLIQRLNVDRAALETLNGLIDQRTAAIAAAAAREAAEIKVAAPPEPPKIIPAKIITQSSPRYPQRALERNIEGWVEVYFQISTDGVPINVAVVKSEPTGVFESAALKAVKRWRFSPARNEQTGAPVLGDSITTKLSFKFD